MGQNQMSTNAKTTAVRGSISMKRMVIDLSRKRGTKGWRLSPLLAVLTFMCASAQNPLQTLPNNYKLIMENEWARVIKVHYAPHEKVPVHSHTIGPAVYVYLADGGRVLFQHVDPNVLAIRPPIKQGAFRMYHALVERHSVENDSDLPSDYLRIELKALPPGSPNPEGRFAPPTLSAGQNQEKVEFEDDNIRIVRSVCWQHQVCDSRYILSAALEIAFTPAMLAQHGATVECIQLQSEQVRWVTPIADEEVWNPGETTSHILRIEFKGAR